MAPAEVSKFADVVSAALSKHHLSGFEIAQLDSITFISFVGSRPGTAAELRYPMPEVRGGD